MNPQLAALHLYPFERLGQLLKGIEPAALAPIKLSIGEPQHKPPAAVLQALTDNRHSVAKYPPTRGSAELRHAISDWITQRYKLPASLIDPGQTVLPVNGTREALFAISQCLFDRNQGGKNLILMPNPFYQIYEGAAILAGAEPHYYNTTATQQYQPDFDRIDTAVWQRCQMIYICTPGNPGGATIDRAQLQRLIALAQEHNFTIVSDECYSEIYPDESAPPTSLLAAAEAMGNTGFEHCLVFNSLSKRSNLPGLRSGFVAGNHELIKNFLLYRTYHGCAMSGYVSAASVVAWSDEQHVVDNRALYREKFNVVTDTLANRLDAPTPDAGFFLWARTADDDTRFCRALYQATNVTVLPGSFLSRETENGNPGAGHVRLALVAELPSCLEAADRINHFIDTCCT